MALEGEDPETLLIDALVRLQLNKLKAQQEAALEVKHPVDKDLRDAAVNQNLVLIESWLGRLDTEEPWYGERLRTFYDARRLLDIMKASED